jgi:predicted ATPase
MNTTDFPYINAIEVKDCFAYQDLGTIEIPPQNGKPFSHLILTGRNGSGKSTILKGVDKVNNLYFSNKYKDLEIKELEKKIDNSDNLLQKQTHKNELFLLENFNLNFIEVGNLTNPSLSIITYFSSRREIHLNKITGLANMDELAAEIFKVGNSGFLSTKFKQFLVNKKINQAFAQIKNDTQEVEATNMFFENLTNILRRFFQEPKLKLLFFAEKYEFLIQYPNGRSHTFEQVSDGFAAFISVFVDLFIRTHIIQELVGDFTFNPSGIVLIDEPENHLHIAAQYEILPLLTSAFPNVQFIVATHSPAVISSIKNTVVYDITSRATELDSVAGSSYSELMVTHFGLENEYSQVGDEILNAVDNILKENKGNKIAIKEKLGRVYEENGKYLTPTLRLELESLIIENQL